MKTKILLIVAVLAGAFATEMRAWGITENLNYTVRLGYNIGGTAPVGMPATIRSLEKFELQGNFLLGFDVQKDFWGDWGVMTGLRFEKKGMKIDAKVKNYHMEIVRGGDRLSGNFTGNNVSEADLQMITLPVMATFKPSERVTLKLGPYVSYVNTRVFKGYAYNGYLRVGDPTGQKINIGSDAETRGTYDFSSDLRRFQFGIDAGVDWRIYRRWGVYADLSWGLTGIHNSDFHTVEQTLYPIFGSLGVVYRLK